MTRATLEPASDAPPPPATGTPAGFGAVLGNRAFLRLWLAQALSQTAQQTINFALLVQVRQVVAERGGSGANTALSLVILCFATPPVLFSALAGVIVDHANKRTIMASVNVLRAVCIAGYLLIRPDWPVLTTLLYIYALSITFSTVGQLFGPAEGATIPLLVPRERLLSANALFSLTYTSSQLLGFVVLGPLLTALTGLQPIYLGVVGAYVICTALILSLPPTPPNGRSIDADVARVVGRDLREVWRFIHAAPLLRKGIGYLTIANTAFLTIAALAPEFVHATLRLPVGRLAIVVTPAGLGMLAGVIVVGRLNRTGSREQLLDRALIAASLFLLGFVTIPSLLVAVGGTPGGVSRPAVLAAMALAGGLGLANAFVVVPSQTLLQEQSTATNRARVLSTFFTVSNAAALLPILFAGILGDLFGVAHVLATSALGLLALGLLAEWRRRRRPRGPAQPA